MKPGSMIVAMAIFLTLLISQLAFCQEPAESVPNYKLNRADEDYRYLHDRSARTDLWDPVKYIQFNDRGDWYLSLGGEARERYEYFDNFNWKENPKDDGYVLQRYFLHGDFHFGNNVRLFTQFQSSLENGRAGGPRPSIDKNELDLHQGFLDLSLGLGGAQTVTLRSGRQELAYGSQRIISVREGPNVRQSFDGFRVMYRSGLVAVDGVATRPAESQRYVFDDATNHDRGLWGVYSVFPLPVAIGGNADLYYLGVYNRHSGYDQGRARETRHSVGARLWRSEKPLDYNFEFLYQCGTFGIGEITAWTAASDTGYTAATLPFTPRFGLKADIASGDKNPNNPDLQTFNPLFPKGAYFSENGLVGPANFINFNPSLELRFPKNVAVTANWDFFWRESTHDGLYNNAVVLLRSGRNSSARYVGSQPQVQCEWNMQRHLTLVAVYAHFLAGPFLRESGPGEDVDYFTTWVTYKF